MKFLAFVVLALGIGVAGAAPVTPVVPVIQEGHPWDGSEPQFAVSPDGKWVISSSDTRAKLWSARGELARDLEMPRFVAMMPVWARDNRQFFLTGPLGTAVYAMPSGRQTREIEGAQLSHDGRFFIRRTEKSLRFSDAATGKTLATVEAHPSSSWPETLDFSPAGTLVAAGQIDHAYSDGKMRVWNVKTGKLVQTLADPRGKYGRQIGVLGPALWSSDGKTLWTGGSYLDDGFAVKSWDVQSGKLMRVWPTSNYEVALREFISPREVTLSGDNNSGGGVLDIVSGKVKWTNTGLPSKTPHIVYLNNRTGYFELRAPAGKTLRGFPKGFPIRGFAGFEHLAYSPDGTLLAAAESNDNAVEIYDAHSGALKHVLPLRSSAGNEAVFSLKWLSNGNVSASSLQSAWIWEPGGKLVRRFAPPKPRIADYYSASVSVAPDGGLFLSNTDGWNGEAREMAHVWNGDGSPLRDIPDFGAHDASPGAWYDGRVVWIDGERVALPAKTGVEIWNLRAGKRESQLANASDFPNLRAVAASPDGKFLLCREERTQKGVSQWRSVLFETQGWRRYRNYDNCAPLAWSGDGSKFIASGQNGEGGALIFSPQSATPLQKTRLDFRSMSGKIAFSPDLKFAAQREAAYSAAHSEIRRVSSGRIAVSLYLFANPSGGLNTDLPPDAARFWLALTPDGFYDGAPGIEKWLRWREGDALLPLGALKAARRKPERVRAALR